MGIQQVFVFIVAAIVFAIITIFGYSAITDFIDKGEQVEFYQFKTEIESSIKKIYPEFGAVRQEEYRVPVEYEQICFVDLDAPFDPSSELCEKDPIACDVWETAQDPLAEITGYAAADENVFLKPPAPIALKVFTLDIDGGFLCEDINGGRFSLRLEGRGSSVELSSVVYQ